MSKNSKFPVFDVFSKEYACEYVRLSIKVYLKIFTVVLAIWIVSSFWVKLTKVGEAEGEGCHSYIYGFLKMLEM
jgi:hypothetical protein